MKYLNDLEQLRRHIKDGTRPMSFAEANGAAFAFGRELQRMIDRSQNKGDAS